MLSPIAILSFIFLLGLLFFLGTFRSKQRLPPGPWGLPIFGNLLCLGDLPHRSLESMAKKYGPIMYLRLGLVDTIVASSPEYAELFLKTHDSVFADKPNIESSKYIGYGRKGLVFAPYGPFWRNIRKFCILELFSNSKIEMFQPLRKQKVGEFVKKIKVDSVSGSSIDITTIVASLVGDITCQMLFGCTGDAFSLNSSISEVMLLTGVSNIADYIPYLGALDTQGYRHRMKTVHKVIDEFLEKRMDEHVQDAISLQVQHRDFIDVMLSSMDSNQKQEVNLDRENVKAILLDIIAAGTDTTTTTVEWTVAELMRNPRVMELVQEELKNVVGLDRVVEEADLEKLEYLKMVVKESMRLHPAGPLFLHYSMEDVSINGYFIPKKSSIVVNMWAIGRDPNVWSGNVLEFYPERFLSGSIDIQGQNFQFLPFGAGRRRCPALRLGLTTVEFIVAQLMHCFNLKLPNGLLPKDLDMDEKYGLTLPRASHLVAIPTYRLLIN